MYPRILAQMREKVRNRQYVMTLHAEEQEEQMDDDDLSIFDVESGVLTGSIVSDRRIKILVNGNIQ